MNFIFIVCHWFKYGSDLMGQPVGQEIVYLPFADVHYAVYAKVKV
jgi:hypothetical protein